MEKYILSPVEDIFIYIYIYICPRVHLILFIFIKEVFSIYGLRNFGFKNQGKSFYFETPKIFISSQYLVEQYLVEQYLKLQKKSHVNLTWDFFINLVGDRRLEPVGCFFIAFKLLYILKSLIASFCLLSNSLG